MTGKNPDAPEELSFAVTPEQALSLSIALVELAAEVERLGPGHPCSVVLGEARGAVQLIVVHPADMGGLEGAPASIGRAH